jgi:two-component system sensor histidine kinase/response regulator
MHTHSNIDQPLSPVTLSELLQQYRDRIARNTSRIFAVLMLLQWAGAIATAAIVSPRTWSGVTSSVHIHVWAAIILGGIITVLPVGLALAFPERPVTRHVVAAGQMLMSALLIHITGGRVETHFHVFGGLAILAFYRDWRVLMTAAVVVYIDHVVRGLYWPQSVYGVLSASPWRAVEHAWWVSFEVVFLIIAIRQSTQEMGLIAERQVKLHSFNSKIEAEVKERTAELSTINKQMETFCYSMSHDLKAPLRGIQSFSQILVADHGQSLDAQAKEYMSRIQESASKLNRLVNDLLEYSRVSTAKLSVSPIDLSTVTREALRLLAGEIQEHGAVVRVEMDLGTVLGHDATLIQVMLNLLGNAVRYGKPGVVPEVTVRSETRGNRIKVMVQDNGIGVATEYQRKIFEIFERVPIPGTEEGTGIGLAIVSKAIERLGGTVGVDSIAGVGSTFWFELSMGAALGGNGAPERNANLVLN